MRLPIDVRFCRRAAVGRGRLGDAEVEDLDDVAAVRLLRQEEVGGLEVAVDDAHQCAIPIPVSAWMT